MRVGTKVIRGFSARFWSKVDIKDDVSCWNWMGGLKDTGYGNFWYNGKVKRSHIVSWILTYGNIPYTENEKFCSRLCVLHKCDNRKCCNPNHLFLGTQAENMDDMRRKGRAMSTQLASKIRRGEGNWAHKITWEQSDEIRVLYKSGNYKKTELARMFSICKQQIAEIINNESWVR
jgi:hypothetical protein